MKTLRFILLSALSLLCGSLSAQDLVARQAPIDYKLKLIDSIARKRLIQDEMTQSPAAALYGAWGERYARQKAAIPDSFSIRLKDFSMPTQSRVIISEYGVRKGRQHKGIDIKVYTGDTIRTAFSGRIRIVRFDPNGYGNYVVIRHHNGLETIYGHMSKNLVGADQEIEAGTPIGLGGNSGKSAASHLHFETRFCGIALDPALLFDFQNRDVTGDYYVFRKNTSENEARTNLAGNTPKENTGTRYHKVVKGETLSTIARKRHTTVDKLCQLNRIGRNARIHPGQILKYN
ncbi:MAG: peptidoglycan DD-metalloendopeptidase family protein [Bacteroidaceae bacterium]|nr:peptidoglycan DD-metalloendopeptidase family protein [Bacteroidaceae bacterium]